jgi:hypothetical protein
MSIQEHTGWLVQPNVLMRNHDHLLLGTPKANLMAGMPWFQGTYTTGFNLRHRLGGHLFQGRYEALLMDPEVNGHFLQVGIRTT